jgi:hypothetical protein
VVNSEVAKRRTALLKRLETLRRWAERARVTHERATKRYNKRWKATKEYGEVLYRVLNQRLCALETQRESAGRFRKSCRGRRVLAHRLGGGRRADWLGR